MGLAWGNGHNNYGSVEKTTNGGANWTGGCGCITAIGIPVYAIHFINPETGWIAAGNWNDGGMRSREIFRTTDGGVSYTRQYLDSLLHSITDIFFIDSNTGWTAHGPYANQMFKTTNGGQNWNTYILEPGPGIKIIFVNSQTGYSYKTTNFLKSTNGGMMWQSISFGASEYIMDMFFVNSTTGFVTLYDGKVFRTVNSGNNWTQVTKLNNWTGKISFIDTSKGWILGDSSRIYYTSTGGSGWTTAQTGINYSISRTLQFLDQHRGYFATSFLVNPYTIVSYVYKTTNGGGVVPVENIFTEIAHDFKLYQNYPNPFNPVTALCFVIPAKAGIHYTHVQLSIYNSIGQHIETLVNESAGSGLSPGTYEVKFDGTDYPSGVYYYQLTAGEYIESRKMILIK
jgi:photosystem II stability/assembly factor-like uncharacterized protein